MGPGSALRSSILPEEVHSACPFLSVPTYVSGQTMLKEIESPVSNTDRRSLSHRHIEHRRRHSEPDALNTHVRCPIACRAEDCGGAEAVMPLGIDLYA
jgi:hypothetical protein